MSDRTWNEDIKALGEKIVALTLLQAKELSDYLKEVHGIEPAAGGAVMMAGPAAPAEDAAPAGPTKVSVMLTSPGGAKVQVIKAVKEITGLGLSEAKALVDKAPVAIKEQIEMPEAEKIKTQLTEAGATVEIKA